MASVIQPLQYYNDRARAEEIAKYSPDNLLLLTKEDPDSVLVATANGEPVGFCISRYDDGLIWLSWFGTKAEFRKLGVGRKLLQALDGTVRGRRAHKIWCDTRVDNLASQSVLEESGFKRIASFTNHWYGHDYFIWEKCL